jgi:hypothetical protein
MAHLEPYWGPSHVPFKIAKEIRRGLMAVLTPSRGI